MRLMVIVDRGKNRQASTLPFDFNLKSPNGRILREKNKTKKGNLVPRRLVRSPMKMERMSFPKEAAFTGSSFCSWQWRR